MERSHVAAILSCALFAFYGCGGDSNTNDEGTGGILEGHVAGAGGGTNAATGGSTSLAGKAGAQSNGGSGGKAGNASGRGGAMGGTTTSAGRGGTSSQAGRGGTSSAGNSGEAGNAQAGGEGGAPASAGGAPAGAGESGGGSGGEGGVSCAPSGELIENGTFEGGSAAFSTEYVVVTAPAQLEDTGQCIIATDPSVVRDGATDWLAFGDHTSGGGNMLICDGSETADSYSWQQTVTVEPHATYELSFWFTSVEASASSLPSLAAAADGVALGSDVVAASTGGTWTHATAVYQAGDNTSVAVSITDTNTDGGENDFALDDISFVRTCAGGS